MFSVFHITLINVSNSTVILLLSDSTEMWIRNQNGFPHWIAFASLLLLLSKLNCAIHTCFCLYICCCCFNTKSFLQLFRKRKSSEMLLSTNLICLGTFNQYFYLETFSCLYANFLISFYVLRLIPLDYSWNLQWVLVFSLRNTCQ